MDTANKATAYATETGGGSNVHDVGMMSFVSAFVVSFSANAPAGVPMVRPRRAPTWARCRSCSSNASVPISVPTLSACAGTAPQENEMTVMHKCNNGTEDRMRSAATATLPRVVVITTVELMSVSVARSNGDPRDPRQLRSQLARDAARAVPHSSTNRTISNTVRYQVLPLVMQAGRASAHQREGV